MGDTYCKSRKIKDREQKEVRFTCKKCNGRSGKKKELCKPVKI